MNDVLIRIDAPTIEPVSLQEVKNHLRIDGSFEDDKLQAFLDTAIAQFDGTHGRLHRAIMRQTWQLTRQLCAGTDEVALKLPPVTDLVSIKYLDNDRLEQTADLAQFRLRYSREGFGLVSPVYGASWPSMADEPDALRIAFRAGHETAEDVPAQIKAAICLLVGHFDKEREGTTVANLREIPIGIDHLVEPYRTIWVA